jgi:hypothetical protein
MLPLIDCNNFENNINIYFISPKDSPAPEETHSFRAFNSVKHEIVFFGVYFSLPVSGIPLILPID